MFLCAFNIFLAIIIPIIVFFIAWILSMRTFMDREKTTPFECGFDPKSSARIPFSLRFFLLAVIFLVFDIEIALLMPLPMSIPSFIPTPVLYGSTFFLIILMIGLAHEWREGSLDWTEWSSTSW
nr:NADH dehydrogenase subunit 3 [Abarenicola claparedi oceanica]